MDEPTLVDPASVILARMEVKLDNALAEQTRHSTIIDRHDRVLGEHSNRLTANETTVKSIGRELGELDKEVAEVRARRTVTPAALGIALTIAITALGILVTFLAVYHGAAK